MQALTPSAGTGPTVTSGIHDLLEQSISRSRYGSGASNHTAVASPRKSATPRFHSRSGTPRLQSRNGRLQEQAGLQAASQAASPTASTASPEEDGNAQLDRTAMPARRQLEYCSSGSNSSHTVNISSTDKSPSKPQVLLANYPCSSCSCTQHQLDLNCPHFQAKKKAVRVARIPSPLNRLHSTPVAALLLGSDRNEQPESRISSTPEPTVSRYRNSSCSFTAHKCLASADDGKGCCFDQSLCSLTI